MIKVAFTENLTGIKISGDFNDLDFLYDSFFNIIKGEPESLLLEAMQNHIYGFLYEVRHAYQGERNKEYIESITDDKNIYYSFNYVLTDLITDMILIKYFILNIKEKDEYNIHLNNINLFYSLVLELFGEVLTPTKFKNLRKGIKEAVISDRIFVPQWFDNITCDYLKQTKEKRLKTLSKTLNAIYEYGSYEDFVLLKIEIEEFCKENNCLITNVKVCEYPEEIEW